MGESDGSAFAREREIFFEALEKVTEESRGAYLEKACGGNGELLGRVRTMLKHHESEDANTSLVTPSACPKCGKPIPLGLPKGLCQRCGFEDTGIESLEIKPGRIVSGHEIVRRLGYGGMGIVYEARQKSLRRSVALKMIRAPSTAAPEDIARFRQEAEAAARLDHPNIVEVYEIGDFKGTPYFTMKYVDGARSLGTQLAQGSYDPEEAAKLLCEIARAVGYAHQRGVIHRDIKPANILLDRDGRPHLVDFGLAKLFGQSASMSDFEKSLSVDGRLMGTPYYMSPEQVRGDDLTTSTDIYSLGVVLYELLTGRPPFKSKSLKDMLQQITQLTPKQPTSISGKIPRDLQVICLKCLRKQPKNRYGTADELAGDLDRWMRRRPIRARPPSAADRLIKWVYRKPGMAAMSLALAILAIVTSTLVYGIWMGQKKGLEDSVASRLATAKVLRVEDRAGRRWEALDSIRRAAENLDLLPDELRAKYRKELQNEAIWSLSLIDLRRSEESGDTWEGDPSETGVVRMSPDFSSYAHVRGDGTVVIRKRPSNEVLLALGDPVAAPCRSLRFNSSDGLHLVAVHEPEGGGFESTVWDLGSERKVRTDPVTGADAVDFSADGTLFAFAEESAIRVVHLAERAAGGELAIPFAARTVRLNRDGTMLAASPISGTGVHLFDCRTGDEIARFEGYRNGDMEWNPLGQQLAMGCDDGTVVVWDTQTDERIFFSAAGRPSIEHVAWHPRGVLVAGSSSSGAIHLWHVAKGDPEVTWTGQGHVHRLQFSREGASGTRLGPIVEGNRVSLLEVAEGSIVSHASGHPGKTHGAWWRSSGSGLGRLFATAGEDGVRIWNRRGFEKAFIDEPGARSAFFTDTHLVISGGNGVSLRAVTGGILPSSRQITIGAPQRFAEGTRCFGSDFFEGENTRILAVATGEAVRIYEVTSADGIYAVSLIKELDSPSRTTFVAISHDGKWVAAGAEGSGSVRVWDTSAWEVRKDDFEVDGSADVMFYRDHSIGVPGGKPSGVVDWFVTSGGSEYKFYDTATWNHKKSIPARLGKERGAISFSPRTPVFAVSEAQKIRIYDLHNFELLMNPEFESQEPVCFSSGGLLLLTADQNFHLHLWDLRLLRENLDKLNLDLELRPFPTVAEPLLIENVTVESEPD